MPEDGAGFVYEDGIERWMCPGWEPVLCEGVGWGEGLCVRDAEGAPKGRSRLAERGETEGALAPEPRSQPDPERSEGARPKTNLKSHSAVIAIPDLASPHPTRNLFPPYLCWMQRLSALWVVSCLTPLFAQVAMHYQMLHQRLFPLVADTTQRTWLSKLRTEMETLRRVEWNDRFFREIATLYLESPDEVPALLDSIQYETGVSGRLLRELWKALRDPDASPDFLLTAWKSLAPAAKNDTTLEGAIVRDLIPLGEASIDAWLPTGAKSATLVEATWIGYLRGLWAAYRFMGFRESGEPWQQKLHTITAIGLLEYYAYGEAANRYRAWKRGYWH